MFHVRVYFRAPRHKDAESNGVSHTLVLPSYFVCRLEIGRPFASRERKFQPATDGTVVHIAGQPLDLFDDVDLACL